MFSFGSDRSFIVGGGQGIGLATATLMTELGASVVIADLDSVEHREAAGRVGATFVPIDVTKAETVESAVAEAAESLGGIDIAVHCAGGRLVKPAESTTDEEWSALMTLNLDGMFRCCRAVGNVMIRQGAGAIVNIASMSASAVNKPQEQVAYNSSKAGVVMMTKSLAAYWGKHGIRVNCVSPGYTKTAMTEGGRNKPDWVATWMEHTPLKRIAEPSEIAAAIAFLASDAASYITGHDLLVDGGYTCY